MESDVPLHFEKEDPETSWGFRLTGGLDYGEPLTVVKVCEGSIAEYVGMRVGDVLVRINDVDAMDLTHAEAHDVILSGKCNFTITVRRGDKTEVEITADNTSQEESGDGGVKGEGTIQKESDLNITDAEIVQIIQGEQQQQQQQEEISSAPIATSEVYQAVKQEESEQSVEVHESYEVQRDTKKWSTFLQRPDKPIRKPKAKDAPKQDTGSGYQVVIKKQKRRSYESAVAQLEEEDKLLGKSEEAAAVHQRETSLESAEESLVQVSESAMETIADDELDERPVDCPISNGNPEATCTSDGGKEVEEEETAKKSSGKRKQSKSSQTIEEQLAQVQEQLLALSRLPSTIQSTLNAVTRQLEKIATATHVVQVDCDVEVVDDEEERSYEATTTTEDEMTQNTDGMLSTVMEDPNEEGKEDHEVDDGGQNEERDREDEEDGTATISEGVLASEEAHGKEVEEEEEDDGLTVEEREEMRIQRQIEEKRMKEMRVLQVLEESDEQSTTTTRMMRKKDANRRRKDSLPLTPLERPIILPGGRKWCVAEDAIPQPNYVRKMSDDSIDRTIETYSEVLVGRVKGINFLKYQPPPKNLDHLQNSAVYKMIHEMDAPPRGISTRTAKVLAAEDYLRQQKQQSSTTTM